MFFLITFQIPILFPVFIFISNILLDFASLVYCQYLKTCCTHRNQWDIQQDGNCPFWHYFAPFRSEGVITSYLWGSLLQSIRPSSTNGISREVPPSHYVLKYFESVKMSVRCGAQRKINAEILLHDPSIYTLPYYAQQ